MKARHLHPKLWLGRALKKERGRNEEELHRATLNVRRLRLTAISIHYRHGIRDLTIQESNHMA